MRSADIHTNLPTTQNSQRHLRGLTLVELLLAMAIVSVMLGIAYSVSSTLLEAREKYDATSRASNILNSLQQIISDDLHNIYLGAGDEEVLWIKRQASSKELHLLTSNSLVSNNGELVEVIYTWTNHENGIDLKRQENKWPEEGKSGSGQSFTLCTLKSFSFSALNNSQQTSWSGNMLDPDWETKNPQNATGTITLDNNKDSYIPGFIFDMGIIPNSIVDESLDQSMLDDSDSAGKNELKRSFTIYFPGNRGIKVK